MNTLSLKNIVIGLLAVMFASVLALSFMQQVRADITSTTPTVTPNTFQFYQFFATSTAQTNFATSTTATSTNIAQWTNGSGRVDNGYFVVAGAKRVDVFFGRSFKTANIGTSTYNIQVTAKASPSETDWYDFYKLVQATSTASEQFANIAAATSTIRYSMNLDYETIYAIRCVAQIVADGQNTCAAAARF